MKYLVLTMRGTDFDPQFIAAHYQFLDSLRENGILEQAGPFTDQTGGAYILLAANLAEARQLAEQDPLHQHGCSSLTIREWNAK